MREFLEPVGGFSWESGWEMRALIASEEFRSRLDRVLAAEASIEFPVPGGGFVGSMGGPFRGREGFLAGWSEWLATFDEFWVQPEGMAETDDGRVLVLATTLARPRGSEASIPQKAAALYTVEGERIARIDHFLDQDQARAAAGLR